MNKDNILLVEAYESVANEGGQDEGGQVFAKFRVFLSRFLLELDPETQSKVKTALIETTKVVPYFTTLIQYTIKDIDHRQEYLKNGVTQGIGGGATELKTSKTPEQLEQERTRRNQNIRTNLNPNLRASNRSKDIFLPTRPKK